MKRVAVIVLFLVFGYVSYAQEFEGNRFCPVTPTDEVEEDISTNYNGRTVYFCCKSCLRDFNKNPEEYLANLPTLASFAEEHDDHGESGHDHSDHASSGGSFVSLLGKLHVVVIHFPIALIPFAAVLATWARLAKRQSLEGAANIALWVGASFAVVAALMGWIAASQSSYPESFDTVLLFHRWLGTSLAALALLVAILFRRIAGRNGRVAVLWILSVLVLLVGHLGGSLIYGVDYLF